jgi:anti-sigma factor RsiW
MNDECEQLDEYLLDLLPLAERQAFAKHLEHCARCRAELAVQRRVDQLLAQAAELELAPPLAIYAAGRRGSRRRWRWAGVGAVAGSVALAAAWWNWADIATPPRTVAGKAPPAVEQPSRPKVTVQLADNVIARPIESSDPRVTIVWTYPVVRPRGGS